MVLPLLAQVEFFDHDFVTVVRGILEIIEKTASFGDHLQKPATRRMVFDVRFKVIGKLIDSLCQQGDLHVGTPGVLVVHL